MTNLEIAEKLREQIKVEWPYVSTILALYANNTNRGFSNEISDMVDRLLPKVVYYQNVSFNNIDITPLLTKTTIFDILPIEWLPINIVLFGSEDNPLGILK